MNDYFLEGGVENPTIEFRTSDGYLMLKGRAIPENPLESFEPLLVVLNLYCENPQNLTKVDFMLEYFNTSSSKYILEILKKLQSLHKKGKQVEINWFYDEDDEEIYEIGEDYSAMVNIPFNLKSI